MGTFDVMREFTTSYKKKGGGEEEGKRRRGRSEVADELTNRREVYSRREEGTGAENAIGYVVIIVPTDAIVGI